MSKGRCDGRSLNVRKIDCCELLGGSKIPPSLVYTHVPPLKESSRILRLLKLLIFADDVALAGDRVNRSGEFLNSGKSLEGCNWVSSLVIGQALVRSRDREAQARPPSNSCESQRWVDSVVDDLRTLRNRVSEETKLRYLLKG